jgi:DnaD/phage-associated family protein
MTSAKNQPFHGFSEDHQGVVRLPVRFFGDVLPLIEDLNQLRLLLYMFWHIEQQETKIRYFRWVDFVSDTLLCEMIIGEEALINALESLVSCGVVLKADLPWMNETYYFINGPQGRAAVSAIENGEWQSVNQERKPIQLTRQKPNIFKMYEENIGPITPLMADVLKQDELTYPDVWISDAIEIAVTHNARNWKYIQAILNRWQSKGRGNEQNRRDNSQDPESYRKSWLGDE